MESKNKNYTYRKEVWTFICWNLLLLLCAQIFCALLSISSFKKLYIDSLTTTYTVPAKAVQYGIENGLKLGKSIKDFYGLEKLVSIVKATVPDLAEIVVTDHAGKILAKTKNSNILVPSLRFHKFDKSTQTLLRIKTSSCYWIFVPVKNPGGRINAFVGVSFPAFVVNEKVNKLVKKHILSLFIVFSSGVILFILCFFGSRMVSKEDLCELGSIVEINLKTRNLFIIIFIFLFIQCVYGVVSVRYVRKFYIESSRNKAAKLGRNIQINIEKLLNKGVALNKMKNMDKWIAGFLDESPEVECIAVLDSSLSLLHIAVRDGFTKNKFRLIVPRELEIRLPLTGNNKMQGLIVIHISRQRLHSILKKLIVDIITTIGISFMFVFELIIFYRLTLLKKLARVATHTIYLPSLLRPLAFAFMFANDLALSFIPLYAENLYRPLWNLPKEFVIGLPISAEMLAAGISILIAGILIDRIGWRRPCLIGFAIVAIGDILSGYSHRPLVFILARAIVGVGYGLSWMAFQGYVFANLPHEKHGRGIAQVTAGVLAGSLCGAVIGGMIAERVGFSVTFYLSALFMVFVIVVLAAFYPDVEKQNATLAQNYFVFSKERSSESVWAFFKNPATVGLGFFFSMPTALCTVGFLYYAVPIYLSQLKISPSTIGRTFVLYGVCLVYVSPYLSKFIDRSKEKGLFLILSGLIGGIALTLFYWLSGFEVALLGVLLLGLATAVGHSAEASYVASLPVVKGIGINRSMALLRTLQRLGQVLGPATVGMLSAMNDGGISQGIVFMGWGYLVFIFIFALSWLFKMNKQYLGLYQKQ